MSKQSDEFNSSLSDATRKIKTFRDALKKNSEALTILDSSLAKAEKEKTERQKANKKLADSIASASQGVLNFTRQLSDSKGSFEPLKTLSSAITKGVGGFLSKLGPIGAIFGGLVKAGGEVANFMIDRFDHTYGIFEKLSDSGVVTSMEHLQEGVATTRIGFDQLSTALAKHSKDLALFGGSATRGTKMFQGIAVGSMELRGKFQRIGVTTDDFADFQLTYLTQQMRTSAGRKKTNDELIAGTDDYINELDIIAKVTGMSRKAINDDWENRMKTDARLRASMMDMPDKQAKQFKTMTEFVFARSDKNEPLTKGLMEFMQGATGGEQYVAFVNSLGGNIKDLEDQRAKFNKGELDIAEFMKVLTVTGKKASDAQKDMLIGSTKENAFTMQYVGLQRLGLGANEDWGKIIKDSIAEQEKAKNETTGTNSKLANVKQKLEQAGIDVDLLATNSDLMTGAMSYFSDGIETFTETLYEKFGGEMPPLLKARRQEKALIKAEAQQQEGYASQLAIFKERFGEDASTDPSDRSSPGGVARQKAAMRLEQNRKRYIEIKEELDAATEARKRVETEEGTPYKLSNPSSPKGKNTAASFGSNGEVAGPPSGGSGQQEGVKPAVLSKKAQLESMLGKPLVVTSGFRKGAANHGDGSAIDLGFGANKLSESEINKLFKGAIDVGFTGIGAEFNAPGGAHIHLDTSHSGLVGWGSDGKSSSLANESPYLAKLINDKNSGKNSARTGGIFTDPGNISDDPEENAGNVGQQALNTSTLTGGEDSKKLDDMYSNISVKMETLIDLMEKSSRNKKDHLEAQVG